MPRNTGIDGSSDDQELTGTLPGKESGTRLPTLTGARGLFLTPRTPVSVIMPPLALYVGRQLDYLRERGRRLAGWLPGHTGLILPRTVRLRPPLPALMPARGKLFTHSPAWWRMLHLIWFRQRRKQKNEPLQRVPVADERQLVGGTDEDTGVEDLYPNELLQILLAPQEKQPVTTAEELYAAVIKKLPSSSLSNMGLAGTTGDLFSPLQATSKSLQAKQLAEELKVKYAGRSATPHIGTGETSSIYQANQIQEPGRRRVNEAEDTLAEANWRSRHSYQSRWAEKVWTPLMQRLGRHPVPVKKLSHITRQSIRWAYTTLVRRQPYLTAAGLRAGPGTERSQQDALPYIASIPEFVTPGEEAIPTLKGYAPLVDREKDNRLFPSLPKQEETPRLGTAFRRLLQSTLLKTGSTSGALWLRSLTLKEKPVSDLLGTRATWRQVPEISRVRWSAPLVKQWLEIAGRQAKATNVSVDSGSMTHSPVAVTVATPDNVSRGEGRQIGQAETPLIGREPVSLIGLRRQPLPATEGIYQTSILAAPQYFKSIGDSLPSDRRERYSFPGDKDYEPSSPRYKDARHPPPELRLTSIIEPRIGSNIVAPGIGSKATGSGEPWPVTFEGITYYGGHPPPELQLTATIEPMIGYNSIESRIGSNIV